MPKHETFKFLQFLLYLNVISQILVWLRGLVKLQVVETHSLNCLFFLINLR